MKNKTRTFRNILLLFLINMLTSSSNNTFAQDNNPYIRIAKIVIDSPQLNNYKSALKEHAKAAVSKEPGVLTMYAVYDKEQPTNVTVFEIYASASAYRSHIQTTHFLK